MTIYREVSQRFVEAIQIPGGYQVSFGDWASETKAVTNIKYVEQHDYLVVAGNYLKVWKKDDFERAYELVPPAKQRASA